MKLEAAAVLSCLVAVVLPVTHGYHPLDAGIGRRTSTAGRDAPWSVSSARPQGWSGVTSLTRMSASSSGSALPYIPADTVAQLWSATPKALLRVGQNGRSVGGLGLWAVGGGLEWRSGGVEARSIEAGHSTGHCIDTHTHTHTHSYVSHGYTHQARKTVTSGRCRSWWLSTAWSK